MQNPLSSLIKRRCYSLLVANLSLALSTFAWADCSYTITNNWGSGFTGEIKVTNHTNQTVYGWSVNWKDAATITNSWNATVSGSNPYTATSLNWNGTLAPNASASFGFQGTGSPSVAVVNGSLCGAAASSSAPSSAPKSSAAPSSTPASSVAPSSTPTSATASSSAPISSVSASSSPNNSSFIIQEEQPGFCSVDGTIDSNNSGYTGAGFANTDNAKGNGVNWAVNAANSSRYTLSFRFANGGTSNRNGSLVINGGSNGNYTLELPTTGSWTNWQTASIEVDLVQGNNNLKLSALGAEGLPNMDSLTIVGAVATAGACTTTPNSSSSSKSSVVPSSSSSNSSSSAPSYSNERIRVINTTDLGADPDDEQSMVRQLVMANLFDIEGLVVATGCWKKTQSNTAMLDKLVNAYGQALPNLKKHADGFPSLEYLKSVSVMGQKGYGMGDVGAGKASPGSNMIIAAADKNDPRPLWVTCWGGCNTIAQAIWDVRNTRSAADFNKFLSKLRVFDILGQDDTGAWMTKNFPNLFFIRATKVYGWQPSDSWLSTNVQSHGPLGAVYPNRKYATEGDSPAFMHLIPNGLHDPEKVDQGGWGGRFDTTKKSGIRGMSCVNNESQYDTYQMLGNSAEGDSISRWKTGYDNDFQARMDWAIKSNYADANHHPKAVVNGNTTTNVIYMNASAGSGVALTAAGSSDPDNNGLAYTWSYYDEPSSYNGSVTINNNTSVNATVQVPAGASGKNIHIILTLRDNGSPNLYAYRRVVINVQ